MRFRLGDVRLGLEQNRIGDAASQEKSRIGISPCLVNAVIAQVEVSKTVRAASSWITRLTGRSARLAISLLRRGALEAWRP